MTTGTIFEGTRKPLRTWFLAMWFVTSQKSYRNGQTTGMRAVPTRTTISESGRPSRA